MLDDANLEGADLRKGILVKAHLNRVAADEAALYGANLREHCSRKRSWNGRILKMPICNGPI